MHLIYNIYEVYKIDKKKNKIVKNFYNMGYLLTN